MIFLLLVARPGKQKLWKVLKVGNWIHFSGFQTCSSIVAMDSVEQHTPSLQQGVQVITLRFSAPSSGKFDFLFFIGRLLLQLMQNEKRTCFDPHYADPARFGL